MPRILIDGRSGSGKSDFARALLACWPGAQLVRLDDIYPGWDGLAAGSAAVGRDVLAAWRWQRWDWERNAPAEWHELARDRPVIVEGCGALSRANRRLADAGIWIEQDAVVRKTRALDRDGDTYRPHWDRWAAQEKIFINRERPRELADVVLTGTDAAHHAIASAPMWRDRLAAMGTGR